MPRLPSVSVQGEAASDTSSGAIRACHVQAHSVPAQGWSTLLHECAQLGFDTLLITPPFATTTHEDAYLVLDHQRLHPLLDVDEQHVDVAIWLRALAALCAQHGMALWMDWMVGRYSGQADVVDAHPDWFRPLGHVDAPDPRTPARERSACMAVAAGAADDLAQWWQPLLQTWRQAGVRGVCCRAPDGLPAQVWQGLLQSVHKDDPGFRFMAWTPGLAASEVVALGDAGFDVAVSSLPWWNGRDTWMAEELGRLRQHFDSVVAPLPALTLKPAPSVQDTDGRRALRLVTCALAFGDGWLVPMTPDSARTSWAATDAACARDIRADLARVNAQFADMPQALPASFWQRLDDACDKVGVWLERSGAPAEPSRLLLLNHDLDHHANIPWRAVLAAATCAATFTAGNGVAHDHDAPVDEKMLAPGEARLLTARRQPMVRRRPRRVMPPAAAMNAPRLAIESPCPCVAGGRFAARRCVGDTVEVSADVFCDGHDRLAAVTLWRYVGEHTWQRTRMHADSNDRMSANITLTRIGLLEYSIEAWVDVYASYRQSLEKKVRADSVTQADINEGIALISAALERSDNDADLRSLRAAMRKHKGSDAVDNLLSLPTATLMEAHDPRQWLTRFTPNLRIEVERRAARFASWYELFPRSQSRSGHGRFDDVMARLPGIAEMGFDVLYMPPIHPIGRSKRKGRNNAPLAEPDDVGSPYAIGAAEGGHEALHDELGNFDDFHQLIDAAAAHGIEVAMDFAIQCSPDHPWLKQHPEWFQWRSDGTVRHAENPPKVYADIVNVDFYAADAAQATLWSALRDVVLFWVEHGVRLFRVDNPHTKPFPFWEWMLADVRARHPDVVFLAEAFTRPKPMQRLARLGFSQSYSYFIWRNTKQELQDYFSALSTNETREYFRPHLFVNTPDINPEFLQKGGRPAFLIRVALACFLSGLWGMYSGFELCETQALEGREEYLDAEKYQLRTRDWQAPGNICAEISQLNHLRRANVELQSHLGLTFYNASDPHVLYFGKRASGHQSMLLIAINVDPFADHHGDIEVPLWEWGLADDAGVATHDLLHDRRGHWRGKLQHIHLRRDAPYAIWRIQPETT